MKNEFIPYEQALELKKLGFDEPCIGYYGIDQFNLKTPTFNMVKPFEHEWCLPAPLYQQAFRWFREKYGLCLVIKPIDDKKLDLGYNSLKNGLIIRAHLTYEKAELACLKKLIELSTKTA
jgi:hypothetical protein